MEINDIRSSTFYTFSSFLTISKIWNKDRQNISCKIIIKLAALSWTCNLQENLHTEEKNFMLMKKLKANHCMLWGLPATLQTPYLKNGSDSSSQTFFRISCSGFAAYMKVTKNCFDRLSPIAYAFWITPDIRNKDMWLIFPTNCLQGLLLSWVIRHVPALFHCFCCRVEMVVQLFQNNFEFMKSNDREGRKKACVCGEHQ